MRTKSSRLDSIKIIISTKEIGSQEELLRELEIEGYTLTQATLSRDLKQLKVAKAASPGGKYIYVLPNNTLYKRVAESRPKVEYPISNGFISLRISGNIAVIRTRPGYASSIAYDIDNGNIHEIIGTIAGDDTILIVLDERTPRQLVVDELAGLFPAVKSVMP